MKNTYIIITLLLALLLFSCKKEGQQLSPLEVSITYIDEAYHGETSNVEINANVQCDIKLYVDGAEQKSSGNGKLAFDVSNLSVGPHKIKVVVSDGDEDYERSFNCKILEKPVSIKFPKLSFMPVKESYAGETAYITAQTQIDSKITLYVDDVEQQSSVNKTLVYDVAALAIGSHKIKIVSENSKAHDEVSFDCVISEKPIVEEPKDYVDLGLTSGTLWATCNVGAENPWDYGDYFAWGEVTTKDVYVWDTYKYCKGSKNTMTKYCNQSDYGYNGFTDNLTVLLPEDDAATANFGKDWRMPTKAEFQELLDNCEWEWTSDYNGKGVSGYIVWDTYFHKTHIFLPIAGYRYGSNDSWGSGNIGNYGFYWSSSVCDPYFACNLFFGSGHRQMDYAQSRYLGQTVRAVRRKPSDTPPPTPTYESPNLSVSYVSTADLGDPVEINANTDISCKITLYIDGTEKQTVNSTALAYNAADLNVGKHQIKVVAVNGDKSDTREFEIEILTPTYIDDGNASIPDMGNEDL